MKHINNIHLNIKIVKKNTNTNHWMPKQVKKVLNNSAAA